MSALDSSDGNPFTGYDNLAGQRQQTTQVPFFGNNTLLDNSWFSHGGYLHGRRFDDGGVRYLSTDQFSINPLTGNIITDDNDKGVVVS